MVAHPHTFEELALAKPGRWELHDGRLVEKPGMTFAHNSSAFRLSLQIGRQLDLTRFDVRSNAGHVRRTDRGYYIPDLFVLPLDLAADFRDRPDVLETYASPLPLVVEIWSPSTGGYDTAAKLPIYRERGDQEVWFIHPYERTVTVWCRQPDGSYTEEVARGGQLRPVALPGVVIDLEELFGA